MRQPVQQLDLVQSGIFLCLKRYSSDGYAAAHTLGDHSVKLQAEPFGLSINEYLPRNQGSKIALYGMHMPAHMILQFDVQVCSLS